VARTLLDAVTEADPMVCTLLLTPAAGAQFAAAAGTRDCAGALPVLAALVTDAGRYPAPDSDAIPTTLSRTGRPPPRTCADELGRPLGILDGTTRPGPSPGPQLGRLHLARVLGEGYQVTSYTPC
jgi:hypothetical protein